MKVISGERPSPAYQLTVVSGGSSARYSERKTCRRAASSLFPAALLWPIYADPVRPSQRDKNLKIE